MTPIDDQAKVGSLKTKLLRVVVLLFFWVLSPILVLLFILWIPYACAAYVGLDWRLKFLWRQRWGNLGKRLLFVYSNSPHWQDYLECHWIPLLRDQAVILNWSERRKWKETAPLEERLFNHYGGSAQFNPIAICFPKRGRVRVIRFWQPFRDYKHGNVASLRAAEAKLAAFLGVEPPQSAPPV